MDHGGMDHGGMNHGGMDHGGSTMQCMGNMAMIWNADYKDTCIVHPALHIHSIGTLIFYCLLIFALSVLYEYCRLLPAQLDYKIRSTGGVALRSRRSSNDHRDGARDPLLVERAVTPTDWRSRSPYTTSQRLQKALLYTYNVALAFFLMLVIMTYNAYLILAVMSGAFLGHFLFHTHGEVETDKGMACH